MDYVHREITGKKIEGLQASKIEKFEYILHQREDPRDTGNLGGEGTFWKEEPDTVTKLSVCAFLGGPMQAS